MARIEVTGRGANREKLRRYFDRWVQDDYSPNEMKAAAAIGVIHQGMEESMDAYEIGLALVDTFSIIDEFLKPH